MSDGLADADHAPAGISKEAGSQGRRESTSTQRYREEAHHDWSDWRSTIFSPQRTKSKQPRKAGLDGCPPSRRAVERRVAHL
jgi:hypothetical protein